MSNIIVTGGSHGLGAATVKALERWGHNVFNYDRNVDIRFDVRKPVVLPITDIDILINNAGVNQIDWLENFTEEDWEFVMDTNAKSIFMMTKACLPALIKSQGTVLNIVSNASHMPMTCSLAYNASKGAAHIMTLQLARELTRKHNITVFGISPNKLRGTEMSADIDRQVIKTRDWDEVYAKEYQLNGLLTREETPPEYIAEFIGFLLQDKKHHKHLSGCVLPYGA